jgi:outer membrane protein assembly complex protein YaeT
LDGFEQKIKAVYNDRGYLQAKVKLSVLKTEPQNVVLQVHIEEGPRCVISSFEVRSNNKNAKKVVEEGLESFKGEPFSSAQLSLIERSANDALFRNQFLKSNVQSLTPIVNDTQDQAKLILEIDDPFKFIFVFRGNHYFSDEELKDSLNSKTSDGSILNPVNDLSELIRNHYKKHGFPNVEVSAVEKIDLKRQLQIITFKIKEHYRVRIGKITVSGRISQNSRFYDEFIRTHSSMLVAQGYYVRSEIDIGLKNLETELRNSGYLRAKVLSSREELVDGGRSMNIDISIDEGPLTIVRRVTYEGNSALSDKDLDGIIDIHPKTPLRLDNLSQSLDRIKLSYLNLGYLDVSIPDKNVVEYSRNGTQATLKITIQEGPKIKVGSILVEGNSFTRTHVIHNEIDFSEGDTLTPDKLEESINRLQRMGIFSRVNIRMLEEGSQLAERTIIISVIERDPGVLNFGIGFNTENEFTTRLYTGLSYRNINGTARVISSRLEVNTNVLTDQLEHRLNTSYIEPFLFNQRTRGRINIIRSKEVTKFDETTDLPFLHENTEIEFFLDREYNKHFKLLWKIIGFGTTSDYLKGQTPELRNVARTGPIFEWDYRDDQVAPTSGSLSRMTMEYSDPVLGSSPTVAYFKSTANFTHYHALTDMNNLVWANSIRGGYLTNLSKDAAGGVPEVESFYMGGRQTIRGYAYNERFPSDAALGVPTGEEFKLKTTSTFYLYKSELRVPITKVFGLSFFYDGGAVSIEGINLEDPYRDSVGIGLNFQTPVGPLNFEVGYKLDRKANEVPFALHLFSFGYF